MDIKNKKKNRENCVYLKKVKKRIEIAKKKQIKIQYLIHGM